GRGDREGAETPDREDAGTAIAQSEPCGPYVDGGGSGLDCKDCLGEPVGELHPRPFTLSATSQRRPGQAQREPGPIPRGVSTFAMCGRPSQTICAGSYGSLLSHAFAGTTMISVSLIPLRMTNRA